MGKSKYTGVTIHSGWYPQLNAGNLSKKFSSKKGAVKIKGYERGFVQQVQQFSDEKKGALFQSDLVNTIAGQAALAAKSNFAAFMMLGMEGKQAQRAVTYKDIAGAEEYKKRSKGFSIRGTHIWYLQGNAGPKAAAKRIVEFESSNTPFNFRRAENWYKNNAGIPQQTKQVNWAMNVLQLDNQNIKKTITVDDIKKAQDTAEELVFKEGANKSADKLGMKETPSTPKGSTAKSRDVSSTELGEIESTELLRKEGHHGLPDNYASVFKNEAGKDDAERWTNFMNNQVLKTWNDYVRKVVASTRTDDIKATKKLAARKISHTTAGLLENMPNIPLHAIQKIKHEFAIAQIDAGGFQRKWRDGIPIGDRNLKTGNRTYASTELQFTKNYEFAVKDVKFVSAVNHTLGLAIDDNLISSDEASKLYIEQQNHHNHMKSNNIGVATSVNGITSSGYDHVKGSVNPRTNVSFSLKNTEKYFEEFTKQVIGNLANGLTKRNRQIQQRLHDKSKAMDPQRIFWAAPYISIEEGLWTK